MDLSKAFSTLKNELFIAKLKDDGLETPLKTLIITCLKDEEGQTVLLQQVPQGSVLEPLLFNINVNYLFHLRESCRNPFRLLPISSKLTTSMKDHYLLSISITMTLSNFYLKSTIMSVINIDIFSFWSLKH